MLNWLPGRRRSSRRILLVSDIPPCTNYTGGLFLKELLDASGWPAAAGFIVLNPILDPRIPSTVSARMKLRVVAKPNEYHQARATPDEAATAAVREAEASARDRIESEILPDLLAFARENGIEAFWVFVEGQTLIRLAHALRQASPLPMVVQVMDPPTPWLDHHNVDPETRREIVARFDDLLRGAGACACISWTMRDRYARLYGTPCVPVVPSLPRRWARRPSGDAGAGPAFRIGFAGSHYARAEWRALIDGLAARNWQIAGRPVEIRAFTSAGAGGSDPPGAKVRREPWLETRDLIAALAGMDLLYCPYGFSEAGREQMELCFPSKLTAYLASGRPVLFHGPEYSGPAAFLREHDAAFLCMSPDASNVAAAVETALTDTATRTRVARNGARAFRRELTRRRLGRAVAQVLLEARRQG